MNSSRHGRVIWITGYSGAGKTTLARGIINTFQKKSIPSLWLDGDTLRQIFQAGENHDLHSRLELALRYSRLCREISNQGIDVVCSTISLFHQVQEWNRKNIAHYFEFFLRVPILELKSRDPKGLYGLMEKGEAANMVGIDLPAEEPLHPDLIIDNYGQTTPQMALALVLEKLKESNGKLP